MTDHDEELRAMTEECCAKLTKEDRFRGHRSMVDVAVDFHTERRSGWCHYSREEVATKLAWLLWRYRNWHPSDDPFDNHVKGMVCETLKAWGIEP